MSYYSKLYLVHSSCNRYFRYFRMLRHLSDFKPRLSVRSDLSVEHLPPRLLPWEETETKAPLRGTPGATLEMLVIDRAAVWRSEPPCRSSAVCEEHIGRRKWETPRPNYGSHFVEGDAPSVSRLR